MVAVDGDDEAELVLTEKAPVVPRGRAHVLVPEHRDVHNTPSSPSPRAILDVFSHPWRVEQLIDNGGELRIVANSRESP